MLKNEKRECPLADEIISYMYGELGGKSELEFETHLADCMTCTDEFAAVSHSRFSVYEWQREEFAHLPTPEMVIPYASSIDVADAVGLAAAVRAWLGGLSFPVAVAAALAVCLGLGFLTLNLLSGKDQPIAVNSVAPAVIPGIESPVTPVSEPEMVEMNEKKAVERKPQPVKAVVNEPRRLIRRSSPDMDRPANNLAVKTSTRSLQVQKAPVLTVDADNDDTSLRLADLFDEVGG